MLKLQPREREYLFEINAISKDQDDSLIFVGMTKNEAVWYLDYLQSSFKGRVDRDGENEARYLSLHDKNEDARRAILASESLMQSFPSIDEQ